MMADLVSGRECWRFSRLQRMESDRWIALPEKIPGAHDGAASADTGHEGIRFDGFEEELPPDFRPRRRFVGLDVCLIRELCRQKDVLLFFGEFFSHPNTAEKTALVSTNVNNFGAEAFDQYNTFRAHPVRHEDHYLVTQRAANRGERDAGVAAGRFRNRVARLNAAFLISPLENVKGHPVLDAAGHIHVLGLCIDDSL